MNKYQQKWSFRSHNSIKIFQETIFVHQKNLLEDCFLKKRYTSNIELESEHWMILFGLSVWQFKLYNSVIIMPNSNYETTE